VDGSDSGLFPVAGVAINRVEPSAMYVVLKRHKLIKLFSVLPTTL
jgi:hypothetical protein